MKVLKYKNYEALSQAVAEKMVLQIHSKPNSVFCLASGSSPLETYKCFVELVQKNNVDYSQCVFVGLDEWLGIKPEDAGSCHYFLTKNVFEPLNVAPENSYLFDGLTKNPAAECQRIKQAIIENNGIDLIIVGIGMNGHIGFNEPGVAIENYVHVVDLDSVTQTVGQKYFEEPTLLKKGITIGLQFFLEAKSAILMANGPKKADIIQQTIEGKITTAVPSTIIRQHQNAVVMLEEAAAGNLVE